MHVNDLLYLHHVPISIICKQMESNYQVIFIHDSMKNPSIMKYNIHTFLALPLSEFRFIPLLMSSKSLPSKPSSLYHLLYLAYCHPLSLAPYHLQHLLCCYHLSKALQHLWYSSLCCHLRLVLCNHWKPACCFNVSSFPCSLCYLTQLLYLYPDSICDDVLFDAAIWS